MAPAKTAKTERLLNLVICLMASRQFVTAEFLRANVIGYKGSEQSADSFKRMLERDKSELRELGIPVETGRNPAGEEGYRITPEHYSLPDIALDRDEAAAVAAAAALWHDPDVAAETQSAMLKLRAAGLEVSSPEELGLGLGGTARVMGDESVVRALLAAIEAGRAVTFTHRSGASTAERTVEPWGVVSNSGRWYLVGHDRDRADTRTFRLSRIREVRTIGRDGEVRTPDGLDLAAVVADSLRRARSAETPARAEIWLAAGRAYGLRRMAAELTPAQRRGRPGDRAVIDIASRSGLVRAVLAAGPDAVVLSPPDLVEAVVAGLDDLSASLAQGAAR